jgi:dienelactone hydrolase
LGRANSDRSAGSASIACWPAANGWPTSWLRAKWLLQQPWAARDRISLGAQDDISSPSACQQVVEGARGRSALARIVVYPGASHDFDRANLGPHAIGAAADPALPEKGHVGTDPAARADSQSRVAEWLAR